MIKDKREKECFVTMEDAILFGYKFFVHDDELYFVDKECTLTNLDTGEVWDPDQFHRKALKVQPVAVDIVIKRNLMRGEVDRDADEVDEDEE